MSEYLMKVKYSMHDYYLAYHVNYTNINSNKKEIDITSYILYNNFLCQNILQDKIVVEQSLSKLHCKLFI